MTVAELAAALAGLARMGAGSWPVSIVIDDRDFGGAEDFTIEAVRVPLDAEAVVLDGYR